MKTGRVPIHYAAFLAIALLAVACVGLAMLVGQRVAFVAYVVGVVSIGGLGIWVWDRER